MKIKLSETPVQANEESFEILDSAATQYPKENEGKLIFPLEKPTLNKQLNQVSITLSA